MSKDPEEDIADLLEKIFGRRVRTRKVSNVLIVDGKKVTIPQPKKIIAIEVESEVLSRTGDIVDENIGFARADIIPTESEIIHQRDVDHELIEELKKYLKSEDVACILTSLSIIRLEDEEKSVEATRLSNDLRNAYGMRGRRIYNLLRTENIDGKIIFYAELMSTLEDLQRDFPGDEHKIQTELQMYLNRMLEFYPEAVWIDQYSDLKKLQIEVLAKMRRTENPIKICARGEVAIDKLNKLCDYLIKELGKSIIIREEPLYKIGKDIAKSNVLYFLKSY